MTETLLEEIQKCVGLCEKIKPLSDFVKGPAYTPFCKPCRKEIDDKGLVRCWICWKWKVLLPPVSGSFAFCKECKEEELNRYKDCFCSLPNSKWLRDMLEWIIKSDLGRDLAAKILEQCTKVKEGKSILLTKMQCHWLDLKFWWCNDHPPFILCHDNCDKYRRRGATFAKWHQSMELIQDEIAFPSFTPLPSEEEWKKCSNGVIDTFRCVNCDKELELRHMKVSMQLSIELLEGRFRLTKVVHIDHRDGGNYYKCD